MTDQADVVRAVAFGASNGFGGILIIARKKSGMDQGEEIAL